eukprot:TRINITY_DN9056_c0_g1_i1.p1 TRINITY_DN9056_c0_g1~~TRINITY_DN9056_c0_g1_i1.p1  ORF type:complete len:1085 (-),score=232.84 TRINITY_DN9056_c0_g1_i1:73-3327(-)
MSWDKNSWSQNGGDWTKDSWSKNDGWKGDAKTDWAANDWKKTSWNGGAQTAAASQSQQGTSEAQSSADVVSGTYLDDRTGKPIVTLTQRETGIHIEDPSGKYPAEAGTLADDRIDFWGLSGRIVLDTAGGRSRITWKNGQTWTRQSDRSSASGGTSTFDSSAAKNAVGDALSAMMGGSSQASPAPAAAPVAEQAASAPAASQGASTTNDWGCSGGWSSDASTKPATQSNGDWTTSASTPNGDSADDPWAAHAAKNWGSKPQDDTNPPPGNWAADKGSGAWDNWQPTNGGSANAGNNNAGSWADATGVDAQQQMSEEEWREKTHKARQRDLQTWQLWNKQNKILPGKTEEEKKNDEIAYFAKDLQSGMGEDFSLYDHVPCTISGPKGEAISNIPQLTMFEDLYKELGRYMPEELINNVRRCGYERPTPVQRYAVPAGVIGRDMMVCAQTGSGKTAAFLIPVLSGLMKNHRGVGSMTVPYEGPCKPDTVIMTPTRELCVQIFDEAQKFCHRTPFRVVRVYGQEPPKTQIEWIAKGADIVVATPGRLWDFVTADVVQVTEVNCLVLDEADRMVQMHMDDFLGKVIKDCGMPPKEKRQTFMFSATFPEEIQKMAQDYLYEYLFVRVGTLNSAVSTVTQRFVKVKPDDKFSQLSSVIDHWLTQRQKEDRMLVFVNSKVQAKGLDDKLYDKCIDTGALHGDLTQPQREENLKKFRNGQIDVMVATDVASRGLDIRLVKIVVNYDLPKSTELYVQRIGRTGRIGHRGVALSFITVDDAGYFHDEPHVLQDLPRLMEDSKTSEIPAFLQTKIDELNSKNWRSQTAPRAGADRTDARGNADWDSAWGQASTNNNSWGTSEQQSASASGPPAPVPVAASTEAPPGPVPSQQPQQGGWYQEQKAADISNDWNRPAANGTDSAWNQSSGPDYNPGPSWSDNGQQGQQQQQSWGEQASAVPQRSPEDMLKERDSGGASAQKSEWGTWEEEVQRTPQTTAAQTAQAQSSTGAAVNGAPQSGGAAQSGQWDGGWQTTSQPAAQQPQQQSAAHWGGWSDNTSQADQAQTAWAQPGTEAALPTAGAAPTSYAPMGGNDEWQ